MSIEAKADAAEVAAFNRVLRTQADRKELQKRLRRELRVQARTVVPPLRQAIAAIPSKGLAHHKGRLPLRALLAKSVAVQVRTGNKAAVAVYMNPRRMPDRMKALPQYMEGSPKHERWRHPVYGNRDVWTGQRSHPYFERGTSSAAPAAAEGVRRVMEQIAREIESR